MSYVPGFPFLGVSNWRELNDRGMNFIPTWETRNPVETGFATWHPNFWSGFARRGTVVPGGECVKKTAQNCKFSAQFASVFSTVCGSCAPKETCLGSCLGLRPSPFRSVRPALGTRNSFPKEQAEAWHGEGFSAASPRLLSRPRSLRSLVPRPRSLRSLRSLVPPATKSGAGRFGLERRRSGRSKRCQ
jgi:hypothetical protein